MDTPREVSELSTASARQIMALGRRIGSEGDPEDLPDLLALAGAVDAAVKVAVEGLRQKRSLTEIGRALGVTPQAVSQRWPKVAPR